MYKSSRFKSFLFKSFKTRSHLKSVPVFFQQHIYNYGGVSLRNDTQWDSCILPVLRYVNLVKLTAKVTDMAIEKVSMIRRVKVLIQAAVWPWKLLLEK